MSLSKGEFDAKQRRKCRVALLFMSRILARIEALNCLSATPVRRCRDDFGAAE